MVLPLIVSVAPTAIEGLVCAVALWGAMGLFTATKVQGFALIGSKHHGFDICACVGTITPRLNGTFAARTPLIGFTGFNFYGDWTIGVVF